MNEKLTMIDMVKNKANLSNLLAVQIYSMVVLRIYAFLCASAEQFPNKSLFIKTVSVKFYDDLFYCTREVMSFIIVHGTTGNVIRS